MKTVELSVIDGRAEPKPRGVWVKLTPKQKAFIERFGRCPEDIQNHLVTLVSAMPVCCGGSNR